MGQRKRLLESLFFMVSVYVIESIADSTRYTGMALDPCKRLAEHNRGKNRFTKGHAPWKLIFTELHPDWAEARKREKYLKTAAGRRWLANQLSNKRS